MDIDALRDDQWERLEPFVPVAGRAGTVHAATTRFVDALLWMARSGARWRDLPERFGPYQTVKRRYYRWIENGTIETIFKALAAEADFEWLQIDTTIIRARKHAASAPLKRGMLHPRDWGVPGEDIRQNCTL